MSSKFFKPFDSNPTSPTGIKESSYIKSVLNTRTNGTESGVSSRLHLQGGMTPKPLPFSPSIAMLLKDNKKSGIFGNLLKSSAS